MKGERRRWSKGRLVKSVERKVGGHSKEGTEGTHNKQNNQACGHSHATAG